MIDKDGIVKTAHLNCDPLGRNLDEPLRLLDALQFHEEHGEVCPAGWQKGQSGMKADTAGVAEYLAQHGESL